MGSQPSFRRVIDRNPCRETDSYRSGRSDEKGYRISSITQRLQPQRTRFSRVSEIALSLQSGTAPFAQSEDNVSFDVLVGTITISVATYFGKQFLVKVYNY